MQATGDGCEGSNRLGFELALLRPDTAALIAIFQDKYAIYVVSVLVNLYNSGKKRPRMSRAMNSLWRSLSGASSKELSHTHPSNALRPTPSMDIGEYTPQSTQSDLACVHVVLEPSRLSHKHY